MCIDKGMGAVASIRGERSTRRHVQQVPPPRAKTKHFGSIGSGSAAVSVDFRVPLSASLREGKLCRTIRIENGGKTIRSMKAVYWPIEIVYSLNIEIVVTGDSKLR